MLGYLRAKLTFRERRWSYQLRKADAPLVAALWVGAVAGLRLPASALWVFVAVSLALNGIGKIADHREYGRVGWNWRDAAGDMLVIGMMPVPAIIWCITGSARVGLIAAVSWLLLYLLLVDLGWSDQASAP